MNSRLWQILRAHLGISAAGLVLILAGFFIAYQFVDPAPPRRLVIATGVEESAYYLFAQRCRSILARDGVELEVRASTGSVENLAALEAPGSDVDVAMVQGGIGASGETELRSLASLFYEPLWVFLRSELAVEDASKLAGMRIAVGNPGSGTLVLNTLLLEENGIDPSNSQLEQIGGNEAADGLVEGRLDAAFFVASLDSSVVQRLLATPDVQLLSFLRAEAYVRRHQYLSHVVLPRGAIDLALDRPPEDVQLVAPVATLVARPSLHPALITLLLQAAKEVCGPGGVFEDHGEFPSSAHVTLPLHADAQRYLERGPPFLQRYLPFWAANFVDRMAVMLIPLLTLAIPLFRLLPPILRWRTRSRIYSHYRELIEIECELRSPLSPGKLEEHRATLHNIEEEVASLPVPLSHADALYHLRMHIRMVQERIAEMRAHEDGAAAERPVPHVHEARLEL